MYSPAIAHKWAPTHCHYQKQETVLGLCMHVVLLKRQPGETFEVE